MFITKTKKALCLSLLVFLTAQGSAEDWKDRLKSWITPKTVSVTGAAIAGAAGAFCFGAAIYVRQNELVKIRELSFPTDVCNLGVDVQSEYLYAPNKLVHDGTLQARVQFSATDPGAGQIFSIQDPSVIICNFSCKYSLDHAYEEVRSIEINDWSGFYSSTYYYPGKSTLAKILYRQLPEKTYKDHYAELLCKAITQSQDDANNSTDLDDKNYYDDLTSQLIKTGEHLLKNMHVQE